MNRRRLIFWSILVALGGAGVMMMMRGHDELKKEKQHRRAKIASARATEVAEPAEAAEPEDVDSELEAALEDPELLTERELQRRSFAQLLEEARRNLPTKAAIKKVPDAEIAHDAPTAVVESAARLGELKEAVERDSSFSADAASFYLDCAQDAEVLSSIRALCLSNLLNLAQGPVPIDLQGVSDIPRDIVELSARIKDGDARKF